MLTWLFCRCHSVLNRNAINYIHANAFRTPTGGNLTRCDNMYVNALRPVVTNALLRFACSRANTVCHCPQY